MKFLKNFLAFILILIIIGGAGYIGYSFLFANHSGHGTTTSQTESSSQASGDTKNTVQEQQSGQHSTTSSQAHNTDSQQQNNNQISMVQSNIALQNKEKLGKSVAALNEALRLMTIDPYAPTSNTQQDMGNMQSQHGAAQPANTPAAQTNQQTGNTPATAAQGNTTTVNIYPANQNTNNAQTNTMAQSSTMQNMGTYYDPTKMEQLHTGLYKISVGMALLDQLNTELVNQAEYASENVQNPAQYYTNRYNLTVQNKNKLGQALTYINEAANLVNINPYISANGLVYDKERMNQIHQSVFKLAESVAALNQLNDDFTKQAVVLSNTAQNYINSANMNSQSAAHSNQSALTGIFGGLFDNLSMSNIVNIVLVIFIVGLIIGIFGFIFSLLKPPAQKT
ncbi:MAG: hypothetical protein N3B21_09695 [Clostridia bacterium]|nr:hypothetical protein [Clostridia bacterium]